MQPKLFTTLQDYDVRQFRSDVLAGIIVGIVAVPLAIAFAIASGVPPQYGLYTAIIGGFIVAAFGGSRVQIAGPTGAFVVVVYGVIQQHGVQGLLVATMMAGVILVALGIGRLGGAIKFVPHPVVTGFTAGIAIIIATGQIPDLFGLRIEDVPADFIEKWASYSAHWATLNVDAVLLSAISLVIIMVWPRISHRVPAPFVALILGTVLVPILGLEVETIGSRFGQLSGQLPRPALPDFGSVEINELISPAVTIALLGAIESLLSAVVADGMIGTRHRSDIELVAQGAANIATPFFGGIPVTGAIARTATNIKNGGRTPVAGIVHAITLLLITLFFGQWVARVPLAVLAAILLVVAYHMSEWRTFQAEFSAPKSDLIVLLTTFTLTIVFDLTVAVQVGMVLAAFLFMKRMSEVTNVQAVTREFIDPQGRGGDVRGKVPKGVEIYEINGPFFFGAAEHFKEQVNTVASKPKVLIILMRNVPAIDSTGMHALKQLARRVRKDGTRIMIAEVHAQPMIALGKSYLLDEIGEENLYGSVEEALEAARLATQQPVRKSGEPRPQPPSVPAP
ncbi:MAG TPA: sulfate permease [Longimicrobiales bacterium]